MNELRHYSRCDKICIGFDQALRALAHTSKTTGRAYPAHTIQESPMTEDKRRHAAGLMRINHTGEVCAQALYHSQGLVSRSPALQKKMQQAAIEEGDHLAWCQQRLTELNSRPSYLNPLWYGGSFIIGMTAGWIGDTWSLGFLAETEQQVVTHLEKHMVELDHHDPKSYAIIKQMQQDGALHRDDAIEAGAQPLANIIRTLMNIASSIMVKTAYHL